MSNSQREDSAMRYKWLLLYWLAVAAFGAASFFIPVAGWAFAVGAFAIWWRRSPAGS